MKINIILPMLAKSGGSAVIYKYVELLQKQGHSIIVYRPILAFNSRRYSSKVINYIHRLYCTCKSIRKVFTKNSAVDKYIPTVKNMFIRDADIVMATSWPTSFSVNKLSDCKGEKIYFVQDFEIWDNKKYGLKSYMLPLKKIVISTWINMQLKEYLNLGPFPIVFNGIDIKKFNNPNKRHKKNGETVRCLLLNHVLTKKGVLDGVKAFELAKEKYPNIVLESFGMCDGNNLPKNVEYTQNPTSDELVSIYNRADIFIFPSHTEGWGLTPLEAMACQCAVVGTRTGFVLDIGKAEENMLICEPGDIEGLADNIYRLCVDGDLRRRLAENGCRDIRKLTWDNSSIKLCGLLEDYICGEEKNEN